jgi:hypothetical protein
MGNGFERKRESQTKANIVFSIFHFFPQQRESLPTDIFVLNLLEF